MSRVQANGLEIEVEQHGDPAHPPVLLIMGLATQLIHWPQDFIDRLVGAGYRVIRFDNRDIGLSERLEHLSAPKATLSMLSGALGLGRLPGIGVDNPGVHTGIGSGLAEPARAGLGIRRRIRRSEQRDALIRAGCDTPLPAKVFGGSPKAVKRPTGLHRRRSSGP